jgi:TonB family protein
MFKYSVIRVARILFLAVFIFCADLAYGQTVSFNYFYSFEPTMANEPPELGGLDIEFPDAARKNGVEGTVKATVTLGENGKTKDIAIVQDLPFGVGDAVKLALERFYFKPAALSGKPVPMKMTLDYIVSMVYDENDKNVTKPRIIEKPQPPYPPNRLAENAKGKVAVSVLFLPDGKLKVGGVSSVMERDFDKAAAAAAEKIKFEPAMHKKSKKPVAQQMTVEYSFKP